MNKNMSEDYKKAYGQVADPSMGTRVPAGKTDDENDALGKPSSYEKESVKDAQEDVGAAKKAIAKQTGHPPALTDNEPHSNSGGDSNSATDPNNYKER